MSFVLFDKLRLFFKSGNVYGHENLLQNQPDFNRVLRDNGEVNFSDPNFLLEQTNVQINRLERYKDYDQMDEVGEVSLALDMYCLHGNTRVPLLDGTCPTIKDLTAFGKKEFWVCSYDVKNGQYISAKAYNPHVSGRNANMVEVLFDDGLTIKCTPNHKFLTDSGFIEARNLCNGQSVISLHRNASVGNHKVSSVVSCEDAEEVYDLYVENHHNFAAGDEKSWVIVHNSDEASLRDPERNHSVFVKTGSARLKLEIEEFLYETWNVDSHVRPMTRYLTKYGDLPLEIVPTVNRDGVAQVRPMQVYNFTRVETKYGDLVGFFFQEEGGEPTYLHPWQVAHMRLTSFEQIFHPYGRSMLDGARRDFRRLRLMEDAALVYRLCLRGDSKVWVAGGYKEIKDIEVGDEVYSYATDGSLKKATVTNHECNGEDRIYRVFSEHREIYANSTHPILVEERFYNNCKWNSYFRYVDVKDLKTAANTRHKEYCHRFLLPSLDNGDELVKLKVSNNVDFSGVADQEFARFFGFMIGCGFIYAIHGREHCTGFVAGGNNHINIEYKNIFNKYVNDLIIDANRSKFGSYHTTSIDFCNFMVRNGFIVNNDIRSVPSWVFKSPRFVQESFIDGYVDAHNYRPIDGNLNEVIELESCSRSLIYDIKELLHRIGWDVGLVKEIDDGVLYSLCFRKVESCDSEVILGVEELDNDLVYDISVDSDEHNFVVDGVPVHNTRAPEKRVFKVPTGNLPPKEREQYIQIIARRFKKHKFIDPTSGELNERYAPHIQDDDYWIPVTSDGNGVEIETLQGAENLDAIADIEYFKKKMVSALKIPFHRVGLGESTGDPGKSIASQSPEFAKAVQWIQDQMIVGIKKIVLVHLALKNYSIDQMKNFEISMTSASAIDELYRIETWASRVDIMGGLKDTGMFPDEWIVRRFTDMTEDELELMNITKKIQQSGDGEEEDEKDFFEYNEFNKYKKMLLEHRSNSVSDLHNKIEEDINRHGHHDSFQKMINDNEFDGFGDDHSYLEEEDVKEAKNIIEEILKGEFDESDLLV